MQEHSADQWSLAGGHQLQEEVYARPRCNKGNVDVVPWSSNDHAEANNWSNEGTEDDAEPVNHVYPEVTNFNYATFYTDMDDKQSKMTMG